MNEELIRELFDFIERSPSCFHVIYNMKEILTAQGYVQLLESEPWELKKGGKYFVTRNGSSLIAFRIPHSEPGSFQIMASHSDSPCFKIKENPELKAEEGHYVKLNVEKYGGMLMAPWFDRPLSVAGRVLIRENGRILPRLVNIDRDLLMIPNLAIHMCREVNDGVKFNPQKDLLPLYGSDLETGSFLKQVAAESGTAPENILGYDLFLYNRMPGSVWGARREFMSIGKLDDLECAFSSLRGFLEAEENACIPVHCVFDNEEVGSVTRQGAASTFLRDTLETICEALGKTASQYRQMLAVSMMLSSDNAHGVHPNYPEKACPSNRPYLNGGVVIKFSANQKYTTDGTAAALFREICRRANVPCQVYTNRSDIPGGSTLGNISSTQVAVPTVDIGLAQLAMHSPYETAGVKDLSYLVGAVQAFFSANIRMDPDGAYCIS